MSGKSRRENYQIALVLSHCYDLVRDFMFRVLELNVLPMAEVLHLLQILHSSCEQHHVAYILTHSSCEQAYFTARVSNNVKDMLQLCKGTLCGSFPEYLILSEARSIRSSSEIYHTIQWLIR
ncbi:Armadillo repeat-containing 6 [Gossypium australe]|uniref:Armadillo repeat-containing 6 n=1 Tax=Gossypium australe TaxID=47621 RepID=A0A5B6UG07_9ROSI|nr:Armadillo repeat-containing 6 [Gossypium australe]